LVPAGTVGWQIACRLRRVLDSHRDGSEHLSVSTNSFDISADVLQVPFTDFATAGGGQIYGGSDRCY
jgi:hypothetical protein